MFTNRYRNKNLLSASYRNNFFIEQKRLIISRHVIVESNILKKLFVENFRIDNQRHTNNQNNTLLFIHTNQTKNILHNITNNISNISASANVNSVF